MDRKGSRIHTYTGKMFWPMDPKPEDVCIEDIAHSLAMQCRFGGHVLDFYSVAEHSVYCSLLVPPEMALIALMHDAAEAYVVDVPRPIKQYLHGYTEMEALCWKAITDKFGLPLELPPEVVQTDNDALQTEIHHIMRKTGNPMRVYGTVQERMQCLCLSPDKAEQMFLARFKDLTAS